MLTSKQIKEIREHLVKAQNPIFFFDNDPDGLCSFLLLQKYLGRGKGIAVKSFPDLSEAYFRKIQELNSDYVFILDKPVVSESFWKEAEKYNLPIVWIDHHEAGQGKIPDFVHYYNPLLNKDKENEPVSHLCYQIANKKEDLWIAVVGCVADNFIPEYYSDFKKEFPELAIESENAFDIVYKSEIGRISQIFSFALKDRTTNVVNMLRFLIRAKGPHDVLTEDNRNYTMHKRFNEINTRLKRLFEKAKDVGYACGKLLFFQYGGDLSISSDLSNMLRYFFKDKYVVVAYLTGSKANISARGEGIKNILLKAIENLEDSTGGGHENAAGARIKVEDVERFKDKLERLLKV